MVADTIPVADTEPRALTDAELIALAAMVHGIAITLGNEDAWQMKHDLQPSLCMFSLPEYQRLEAELRRRGVL
jgi:hypothetical protein